MLSIDYDITTYNATLTVEENEMNSDWFRSIYRILSDSEFSNASISKGCISVKWWVFSSKLGAISAILQLNEIKFQVADNAKKQIDKSKDRIKSLEIGKEETEDDIRRMLIKRSFVRTLKDFQLRNVKKLSSLNACATFSVPGAGKTTEALAYYFLKSTEEDSLLVVCPKNAFSPWEEQLKLCIGDKLSFIRLRGGREAIASLLKTKPKFAIITYQQLARVSDLVGSFLTEMSVFMFLDESHKIKSGKGKITVDSILSLSHLPKAKLILSGTPMPQSIEDLLPQYGFLYPEKYVDSENIEESIRSVYVRTTKKELDLPELQRFLIPITMSPIQENVYGLIRSELLRQAEQYLTAKNKYTLRQLGKSIMRILMIVSNPLLIATNLSTAIPKEKLDSLLSEGDGAKIHFACYRARELSKQGKKVIIWTTFRKNVEFISERLSDLNAVFIHGGVDAGDEDNSDTREGRIKRFHNDETCRVLVANPAAASEGISLHTVCKNAIYIDRTFNAAHYLQSEDRIHRLGLLKKDQPKVEILYSPNTIDEVVNARLIQKVARMSEVLEDASLRIDPIQIDPFDIDDETTEEEPSLDFDDIKAMVNGI